MESLSGDAVTAGLLERDRELKGLDDALSAAERSDGGALIVEGAPGVGKSSVLRAARALAEERGFATLVANGGELERDRPFGVARQLLETGGFDRIGPAGSLDSQPAWIEGLHSALLDRIYPERERDAPVPHLLIVDDVQWADEPSLRFLAHVCLRAESLPVLLLAAFRTGERSPPRELDALRSAPRTGSFRLEPLGEEAVRRIVRGALGADVDEALVSACFKASGGYPFYLHELVRELAALGPAANADAVRDAAPESVLRAVLARLAHLGADHSALASAVVILGDDVPLETAAELAGLSVEAAEAAADDLAASHLLAPGAPLRMAHPLVASTLRADMGAFARARAHARAAEIRIRNGDPAEVVAPHLIEAPPGSHPDTARILREAAALNRTRGAQRVAVALLKRALEEPRARDPELILELSEALADSGDPEAIDHLEAALGAIFDPEQRARAMISLAGLLHHAGEFARAAELARRSQAELPADHPLQGKALAAFVVPALVHPPLVSEAADLLDDLLRKAEAGRFPSDPSVLALAAAYAASSGRSVDLVLALAERAFADHPLIDASSRGAVLGYAAEALYCIDHLDVLEPLLIRAIDRAERDGAALANSIALHKARLNYHRGRLDQAVADAERSLEIYQSGWARSAWSTAVLARAHLARGDPDAAREALEVGERGDPERIEHALFLEARAAYALDIGDPESALADARTAMTYVGENFRFLPARTFELPRLAALALHALGERDEAQVLIDHHVDRLRHLGSRRQLGAALCSAGLIVGGNRGLELLTDAVEVLEGSPSRFELATAIIELGSAQRRSGARNQAKEALLRGFELAHGFGALPLVDRARSELGALGLRPRRAARTGRASLTPGELRVAELAARGLSTPQIAHELHITRKTVESHLTHIYRKLEIRGRRDLPAALADDSQPAGR
ncbi:MAG TPA: AAA family ATPase [Solirubrobacterales bacterium]